MNYLAWFYIIIYTLTLLLSPLTINKERKPRTARECVIGMIIISPMIIFLAKYLNLI